MKLIAKLKAPKLKGKNYQIYGGADISGGVLPDGKLIWACTAKNMETKKQENVIFVGNGDEAIVLVPTADGHPLGSARGALSIAFNKAYYVGFDKSERDTNEDTDAYMYELDELGMFSVVNTGGTVSTVDQTARTMAQNAQNEVNSLRGSVSAAAGIATDARNIANNAITVANGKIDENRVRQIANEIATTIGWQQAENRIYLMLEAIRTGKNMDNISNNLKELLDAWKKFVAS